MRDKFSENWIVANSIFYISIVILCTASYSVNVSIDSNLIEFRYDRFISIVSFMYFSLLLLVSFKSNKAFWFIYPFAVLTVPNAVNSIFPGFYLTHMGERGNASFAFISHIDVFLLSNILINAFKNKLRLNTRGVDRKQLLFLCLLLAVGLLYNCFDSTLNDIDYVFVLNGAFHYRYLFLTLLIAYQLKTPKNETAFITGLMLSIPLLALEAIISTLIGGVSLVGELKSGNFANNVFGNFLGFLFIFFFALDKNKTFSPLLHRGTQLLLLALLLMTGVRGAMLSILIGLLAYYLLIRLSPLKIIMYCLLIICFSIAMLFYFDLLFIFDYVIVLFDSFQIVLAQGYGASGVVIDENNSSLITRVAIWKGTVLMAMDNWFFGVGSSQWNYLKETYGIPFRVLLDPHNDYLNFFCLYGISGILFIYILYVKPSMYVFYSRLKDKINPYQIALFTLAISSITNANNSKHQVFAIIIAFIILSIGFNEKLNTEKRCL